MNTNTQRISTFLSNGLIYGLNGIITILPLYLSQYFDSVQMGYLLAIPPLLLCIAPLFWGNVTDRAKNQNNVLITLTIFAAVAFLSLRISSNFYFTATILVIFAFFQSSFGSLIDVLTIRSAEKLKMNYGFFRIMGALVYGLMAWFVTLFAKTEASFVIFVVSAVLACVFVSLMPKVNRMQKPEGIASVSVKSLLKNRELMLLILIIAMPFFAWGYYQNFFPVYITEGLGLNKSIWGMMAFLNAFSELPFFFYYGKIFSKFRLKHIVIFSCIVIIFRYLVYTFVTNTTILVAVTFVTGLFITVLTYCITRYIVAAIAPNLVNRAQSLFYAFGTGVPKMLAGCIGGYLTKYLGVTNSFLLCAGLVFISFLLAIICKNTMDGIDERIIASKYGK